MDYREAKIQFLWQKLVANCSSQFIVCFCQVSSQEILAGTLDGQNTICRCKILPTGKISRFLVSFRIADLSISQSQKNIARFFVHLTEISQGISQKYRQNTMFFMRFHQNVKLNLGENLRKFRFDDDN